MTDPRVRQSFMWVAVLVAGMLIGSALMGTAGAAPAGPPGGLEVAEQNTDSDGFIAVHEQGVADVNVTGGSLDANVTGTVSAQQSGPWNVGVNNLPAVQEVSGTVNVASLPGPSPATRAYTVRQVLDAGDQATFNIAPPINASLLSVDGFRDEVRVHFESPIATESVIKVGSPDDNLPQVVAIPLTQPIPINSFTMFCYNESEDCAVTVAVVGD